MAVREILRRLSLWAISVTMVSALSACSSTDREGVPVDPGPAGAEGVPVDPDLFGAESALATIAYLAIVEIDQLMAEPNLDGASSIDSVLVEVIWSADGLWSIGAYEPFDPPAIGESLRLIVDDRWDLAPGQRALIAVTARTRPTPESVGYIRVVGDEEGTRWQEPDKSAPSVGILDVLDHAGALRPNATPVEVLVESVEAAREWIDRVNGPNPSNQEPGGILAEIVAADID